MEGRETAAVDTESVPGPIGADADGVAARDHGLLIGGRWTRATDDRRIPLAAPATGLPMGTLARGGEADVDAAVRAARGALDGEWGRWSATERGRLLSRLSARVLREAERLAWIESHDTGKPIPQGRADIQALARYLEFYGGAADKIHGQTIPFQDGCTVSVVREPHGVTGHIVPWNYPAQIFGRSVGCALAMGNACVVKPSEEACLSLLEVARLALEEGLPPGALNVVTGFGTEAGAALAAHPGVAFVSFTGSPEAGAAVQRAAAGHHAPVTLELGGKSPQLVFADADLPRAAAAVVAAIVQNAGQTCSAGSRVLVQRDVFDAFMAKVADGFRALRVGTPGQDADLGPLISARQRERVRGFIDEARRDGLPVIARATLPASLPEGGHWVAPVVFGPVDPSHRLAQEEIFGPVLAAIPFEDEDDAARIANGTPYGLVAGVWTRDADRLARLARRLRCGQVFLNCYGAGGGIELPFGGVGRSGHGREKGFAALEEMSITKTVVHRHG